MFRYFFSILIVCFYFLKLSAQDTAVYMNKKGIKYTRADYVDDKTGYIQITPFLYNSRNHFELQDKRVLTFEPNESVNVGIRLMHKWLGLAFSVGLNNTQAERRGNTDYINFQLNSYGKKVGFDIYYSDYTGYYLENYKKFAELAEAYGNRFPIRSDISTTTIGANTYYIFNHKKYSYRSTFVQNEIQKKSAGSLMLNASISYFRISGDSAIVPRRINSFYEEQTRFEDGNFHSVSLLPGYSHTLVLFKRFFITGALLLGVTGQYQEFSQEDESTQTRWVTLPRGMSRFGFGYNGNKFYAGLTSMADAYNLPLGNQSRLTYFIASGSIYFGMRLQVPKALKKISKGMDYFSPALILHHNR